MSSSGNPLLNQPPQTITLPTGETVNVSDVTSKELDPKQRAALESLGQKDAGWFSNIWANLWASIVDGVSLIVTDFASVLDTVLAGVGKFFLLGQGEKNAAFYDLAGTILEDLTGVPVDKAALKSSAFGSGRLAGMQTFGADLYNELAKEFAPADGTLEEGSAAAAEKFLGFLMNFAIRQGNIELLTSMLPEGWRVGDGFRAYGELMAKNLGLGRMARRALQPLIQTTVADPLQYKLNEQYRPKRLAKEQAIKQFFRNSNFETQMRKELAQEGFSDARIDDLIADARPLLADRETIELMFRNQTDPAATTHALTARGWNEQDAQQLITVHRPFLDKNEIALLYVNNKISRDTALQLLKQLGFDNSNDLDNGLSTAALVLDAHSLSHAHAHRLGLGVLKKMLHDNVIDVLEFAAQLASQGYSQSDIQLLQIEFLQPTTGKVRQLSLAEIKAGFKAGALNEIQAEQHLKILGYSDADIAVILKTLPTPKPPATPTPPPVA